ncbi:AfsR/SARP family transcriptional regulator [Streptomyces sp. NPDC002004]
MADDVRIRVLGGFGVAVADRPVAAGAWRLRKARSLLKLLALAPGHRLHRDRVYDLLWPDLDATAAANNLHQVLHAVRRALASAGTPGDVVGLRDDVLILGPDGDVAVDLDELEDAARRAAAAGDAAAYRHALGLAAPDLLPEDVFEPWTQQPREALAVRRTALRTGLAEALEREGAPEEAVEVLRALVADDEWNEPGHRALMRVLAAAGRRREALAVYEGLRDVLRRDMAADPDPQTRRLYRTLLVGSVATADEDAGRGRPPRHNLPAPVSSFIGRERECEEVRDLLARSRLLTLTGPGGCGKTRLGLAVAGRAADGYRDGARFVDLGALTEPRLVPEAVAGALDIQLPPSDRPQAALVAALAVREVLLVLDNCEHLIEPCAALVTEVLTHCPGVTVLATSREPLQTYGERTWRVPSLPLPDPRRLPPPGELDRFASVRLFVERAGEAEPQFRLDAENAAAVAQICFRLDGMPLALELAAARVRMMTPHQIAGRLDDALTLLGRSDGHRVTRQQTLLATLRWSHDLLDADERRLFRRLAVFAGSFSLTAVEQVCAADGAAPGVLDVLGRLVDKSLVLVERQGDEARYRLLETIRQYARDRLRDSGELADTERRHRGFYLALAESYDPELTFLPPADAPAPTLLRLEADHDNLRAALGSALRTEPDTALRLAVALRQFWADRGHFAEGRRRLDDALAAAPAPTPLRARALMGQGVLAIRLGDSSRLASIGTDIVAIHRPRGDRTALAYAYFQQAVLLWMRGSWDRSATALDEACALADGDPALLAVAAHQRGIAAMCREDAQAARDAFALCLRLLDAVDDATPPFFPVMTPGYTAQEDTGGRMSLFFEETVLLGRLVGAARAHGYAESNLAWSARLDGDLDTAAAAAGRSVVRFRELGDPRGESLALTTLGNVCRVRREHDAARSHLDTGLRLRRRLGDRREAGISQGCIGLLALDAGDIAGARAAIGRALAGFEETDDLPGTTNSLLHLGLVARADGDTETARALFTRAMDLEGVAGSTGAAAWVAVMLAQLTAGAGDRAASDAAAGRARALFDRLGDRRGQALLRRTAAGAQSGR